MTFCFVGLVQTWYQHACWIIQSQINKYKHECSFLADSTEFFHYSDSIKNQFLVRKKSLL